MTNKKIQSWLLIVASMITLFTGCTSGDFSREKSSNKVHEAITIQSSFRNMSAFIDAVHEKYPEINLEVIPYSGQNYTAYTKAQITAGDMPDIYCTT